MNFFLIIVIVALAWLIQGFLGFYQVKNFNHHYMLLRRNGRVAIGRQRGWFRSGTVVMLALDSGNKITKALRMQGVTVFSRMRPLDGLVGLNLSKIKEEDIAKYDKLTKSAVNDAKDNLKTVMRGEEIKPKPSLFEKIFVRKKKA
ncbi:transcriptional regulator GutM [Brevibacillus daliensis]|uniref:transcriptional regulator GutM n=1 Tax=Brevibacillus daliensis TaxID=2892995 RepID=UPI001E5F4248|nr:transcriptional regulator GutM [Brevibacillus daliensis]